MAKFFCDAKSFTFFERKCFSQMEMDGFVIPTTVWWRAALSPEKGVTKL
jgi:hypothetical protein